MNLIIEGWVMGPVPKTTSVSSVSSALSPSSSSNSSSSSSSKSSNCAVVGWAFFLTGFSSNSSSSSTGSPFFSAPDFRSDFASCGVSSDLDSFGTANWTSSSTDPSSSSSKGSSKVSSKPSGSIIRMGSVSSSVFGGGCFGVSAWGGFTAGRGLGFEMGSGETAPGSFLRKAAI